MDQVQLTEKQKELINLYRKSDEESQAKIFLKTVSMYNEQYGIESDFELLTDQDEIELIRNYRKLKQMGVVKE